MADGIQTSTTLTDTGLALIIDGRPILMLSQLSIADSAPSNAVNVFTSGSTVAGYNDIRPAATEAFENIKGQSGLISVSGTLVERWTDIAEEVFGAAGLPMDMLSYQGRVVTADEILTGPAGIRVGRRFYGGLINNISTQRDASGNHIVQATFQMTFTRKRLINRGIPRVLPSNVSAVSGPS